MVEGCEMKPVVLFFIIATMSASISFGQAISYSSVTNLWDQGAKTNVLELAENALSANKNDIAAITLKLECDIVFVDLGSISNSISRYLAVGIQITNENFASVFEESQESVLLIRDFIPKYDLEKIPFDRAKGERKHIPLLFQKEIEALWKDGFLSD